MKPMPYKGATGMAGIIKKKPDAQPLLLHFVPHQWHCCILVFLEVLLTTETQKSGFGWKKTPLIFFSMAFFHLVIPTSRLYSRSLSRGGVPSFSPRCFRGGDAQAQEISPWGNNKPIMNSRRIMQGEVQKRWQKQMCERFFFSLPLQNLNRNPISVPIWE